MHLGPLTSSVRIVGTRHTLCKHSLTRRWQSSDVGYTATATYGPSLEEARAARVYCVDLLRQADTPSYTLLAFIPPAAQSAYLAIRAFNIELARIADTSSTPHVGLMRLQFWRDSVTHALEGSPPKQPVATLLAHAAEQLSIRTGGRGKFSKSWFMRIIAAREQYMNNNPYPSLDALESYAESTYSTLLYLTLQALPMNSVAADHVASHIGKAAGIVTVLRGVPLLAFPRPPNHHTNNAGLGAAVQEQRTRSQQGSVNLPLDIMAETGLREEDVLRRGPEADGLRDAVFKVATRASDHLITARSMLHNLRKGEDVDHAFEHEHEEEHSHDVNGRLSVEEQASETERAFGIFMPAVSTELFLQRLQKYDFDIFRDELRRRDWRLPLKAYLANRRQLF